MWLITLLLTVIATLTTAHPTTYGTYATYSQPSTYDVDNKPELTYTIANYPTTTTTTTYEHTEMKSVSIKSYVNDCVDKAVRTMEPVVPVKLKRVEPTHDADIKISFYSGSHEDCPYSFDDAGAHTYVTPRRVQIHLDGNQQWKPSGRHNLYRVMCDQMANVLGVPRLTPVILTEDGSFATYEKPMHTEEVYAPRETYDTTTPETYTTPATYTKPEPVYQVTEKTYGTPERVYAVPEKTYSTPERAYAVPEKTYSTPAMTYTTPSRTYVTPERTYTVPEQTYTTTDRSYEPVYATTAEPTYTEAPKLEVYSSPPKPETYNSRMLAINKQTYVPVPRLTYSRPDETSAEDSYAQPRTYERTYESPRVVYRIRPRIVYTYHSYSNK